MKILIVNSNRYKMIIPAMPFGMCYVAAAIEEAGYEVRVMDLCFSKNPARDITETVDQFKPDIVGISIRNIDTAVADPRKNYFLLKQVKDEVVIPFKKVFSGPIVVGGTAVGISGPEILEYMDLEFAIRGDGEKAMVEFIKRIEKRLPLAGLGGLIWRKGDKLIEDNPPMLVDELDTIPHAKQYHYIDVKPYRSFESPIQIQTKRGCPHKCIYCTYNEVEGRRFRLRDPQLVADEIEEIVTKTGINHIEFTDNTFNMPLDHSKAVLKAIAAKKLKLHLCTMGLNPAAIDEELADLMKETNFQEVDVGADSGCDEILRNLGKSYTKEAIFRAAKILHERDIPVRWFMLIGAPGETRQTLRETFDTMNRAAAEWDLIGLGIGVRIYRGTPIAKKVLKENPNCTKDHFLHTIPFHPKSISLEEVYFLAKEATYRYSNYLIFEDIQHAPPSVLKMQTKLVKLLAPKQPVWKAIIFMNKFQKALGISYLKRKRHEIRNRKSPFMPEFRKNFSHAYNYFI